MAAGRPKKRASRQSAASEHDQTAAAGIEPPSTPDQSSPIKKGKMGLTTQQKQALIDNLQLEITERARRLRAQCHLQAQGMRSRIEIRVNRVPTSLRKMKMGDLLLKCIEDEKRKAAAARPPPVPVKDASYYRPASPAKSTREALAPRPARAQKRTSDQFLGDKENDVQDVENPKKKSRANYAADTAPVRPGQVLSPTSSNSRVRDRPASPNKSQIARPGSPLKSSGMSRSVAATSVLSSMVEKAKATRNGAARKLTTASTTSSNSSGTAAATAATRGRRTPAPSTASKAAAQPPRPATRTGRRVSNNSETSEGSTGTVIRKTVSASARAGPPATKKTVMGSIRKGVAGVTAKKTASKAVAPTSATSTTSTGRILRKRGQTVT